MRGSRRVAGSVLVVIGRASALAALELRVEGVVRRRAARARSGRTRRPVALDADHDAGALGEAVLHLDVLAVGDADLHPRRLRLSLVVHDEDERRAPAVGFRAARRARSRSGIGAPSAPGAAAAIAGATAAREP